jgi:ComF family protein
MGYSPCYLCHAHAPHGEDFCLPCLADMPWNTLACQQCALPMTDPHAMVCRQCSASPPIFDRCFASLTYARPINHLLTGYKHQKNEPIGAMLARLMVNTLSDDFRNSMFDAVVMPVPMHPSALRQRGFNQAQQLAQKVAAHLSRPLSSDLVAQRMHISQQGLNANERRKNLRNIFAFTPPAPKHCLIVDDVMTTGATVTAVAEVLKQRGCDQISVLCLARTPVEGH